MVGGTYYVAYISNTKVSEIRATLVTLYTMPFLAFYTVATELDGVILAGSIGVPTLS